MLNDALAVLNDTQTMLNDTFSMLNGNSVILNDTLGMRAPVSLPPAGRLGRNQESLKWLMKRVTSAET